MTSEEIKYDCLEMVNNAHGKPFNEKNKFLMWQSLILAVYEVAYQLALRNERDEAERRGEYEPSSGGM